MRRPTIALALAALVALAGCSAFGLGGTATETPEPTPSGPLPPGVEADGDVNETALARGTIAALNDSAWRLRHRNGPNRTVVYRADNTTYVRDDRGATWSRGNLSVTNETYVDAELASSYEASPTASDPGSNVLFALAVRLASVDLEWKGTRTVDGERRHVLTVEDAKGIGEGLDHYTGTMLVDASGRIHEFGGEVGENESAAVRFSFDFEWGIDSVPRPAWVDAVPLLNAERVAGGGALRVAVTDGRPVPAGTELTVRFDGASWQYTLEHPLAPGESLYLCLREADGERTLVARREPLDGTELIPLAGGQVVVDGTAELSGRTVSLRIVVGSISF